MHARIAHANLFLRIEAPDTDQRHAGRADGGRVHIGVGVDPEHAQRTATATGGGGGGRHPRPPASPRLPTHRRRCDTTGGSRVQCRARTFCLGDRPGGFPVRAAVDRLGRSRRSPARRVGRQGERFSGPMGPYQPRAGPRRDPAVRRSGQFFAWGPWQCLGDRLAELAAALRRCLGLTVLITL